MDVNIIATLTITFLAVILFATEKIRMDAVAIIVLVLLVITHQAVSYTHLTLPTSDLV